MQYVTACKHELSQFLYEFYFMYFNFFSEAFHYFPFMENFLDPLFMLLFTVSARQ